MFKLLIVDDEYIVRTGIRETVDWESNGIEIIGEAADGIQGLQMVIEYSPDIVLTDVRMQTMGGIHLLKEIKKAKVDCEVIIISGYEEFEYVRESLREGAFSYLVKPVDNGELIETVLAATKKLTESRKTMQYFDRLSDELSSVKVQFLRDVLTGNITNEQKINENLDFYKASLHSGSCVVISLRVNEYKPLPTDIERRKSIANKLINIMETYALGEIGENSVFIPLSNFTFAIIVNTDQEYSSQRMRAIFKEVAKQFEEKTGFTLSIGIGNEVRKISQIYNSYKNADNCFNERTLLKGNSHVIAFDDVNNLGYKREVQEAIRYICENYARPITVEMVASELYISSSYLMHLLKDELNKTFNEIVTEYRMITAKELLSINKYKVYEVSAMVGYKDVKYFSQIFKKYWNYTPSKYSRNQI